MRILVCSAGSPGHQRPLVPLVSALAQAGCDLLWATSPDALEPLRRLPRTRPVGIGVDMQAARATYRARWPEASALRGESLAAHTFPRLFGGVIAPTMVEPLGDCLARWKPSLVIGEPAALAVPIACAAAGLPHVTHGYGLRVPRSHLDLATAALAASWSRAGVPPQALGGLYRHGYIDIVPSRLREMHDAGPSPRRRWALRPVSGDATLSLPDALDAYLRGGVGPVVYLTFGTVYNDPEALVHATQALCRLPVRLIVTHGSSRLDDRWKAFPPEVFVTDFVDQAGLLPHCDLVVSHGGSGTVLGVAAAGVRQLLLPRGADQFRNARAIEASGAGTMLGPSACEADAIQSAAWWLLQSREARCAAQDLAAEIAGMPDAGTVAAQLLDTFRGPPS